MATSCQFPFQLPSCTPMVLLLQKLLSSLTGGGGKGGEGGLLRLHRLGISSTVYQGRLAGGGGPELRLRERRRH